MRAFLTSIGERTTQVCKDQLERYGFEVVMIEGVKPWIEKYREFLELADEDCLRVDADVIVNENVKRAVHFPNQHWLMIQFQLYDLYQNNVYSGQPVYYKKEVLGIIKRSFHLLDPNRPEATAWRLPEVNPRTKTEPVVAGTHGWGASPKMVFMAEINKKARGQEWKYDFALFKRVTTLYEQ